MSEYGLYSTANILRRALPRRFAYWIGLRVADSFYHRDRRGREAVMSNLRRVFAYQGQHPSDADLRRMARQTFRHFSKYLVDFFRYGGIASNEVKRLVHVEHLEYLDECRALGRGVLLVSAHFGNWELGGCALAAMGYPIKAVVLPQPAENVDRLFQGHRRRHGLTVIPLGNSVRHVIRSLRNNECVALLADRDYSVHDTWVPFLGAPARMPRGPAWISHASGAPILPGFLVRRPDDTFLLRFHPPIRPAAHEDSESIQRALSAVLEKEICQDPVQWLMFQDVWSPQAFKAADHAARAPEMTSIPVGEHAP